MDFLRLKYFIPQIGFCQDRKCPKIQLIKHILIEPVSTQVKWTKNKYIPHHHQHKKVQSWAFPFVLFLILCKFSLRNYSDLWSIMSDTTHLCSISYQDTPDCPYSEDIDTSRSLDIHVQIQRGIFRHKSIYQRLICNP